MGVNVYLEDERHQQLKMVIDPHKRLKRALEENGRALLLLRYVDPYGEAIFNHLQAAHVLSDLDVLASNLSDTAALSQLREVREIVASVGATRHLYVRFSGD